MDLATQAVTTVNSGDMLSVTLKSLAEVAAQNAAFPSEVAVAQDMPVPTEWLQENVGHVWGSYTRAVTVDEGEVVDEQVFQFKTDAQATLFKRMFGGVAPQ